jgi:hypothetical protein
MGYTVKVELLKQAIKERTVYDRDLICRFYRLSRITCLCYRGRETYSTKVE